MQKRIGQVAAAMGLTRCLTLTLEQSACRPETSVKYIRKVWSKFRVYLGRRYGSSITFIAVVEPHKSGYAHLHILVDRFIPQAWISAAWEALGGGRVVHIMAVDVRRIPAYVAKYLTKEMFLIDRPPRQRRYTTSRNVKLLDYAPSGKWKVLEIKLERLFQTSINDGAVVNARFDEEKVLERFEAAEPE